MSVASVCQFENIFGCRVALNNLNSSFRGILNLNFMKLVKFLLWTLLQATLGLHNMTLQTSQFYGNFAHATNSALFGNTATCNTWNFKFPSLIMILNCSDPTCIISSAFQIYEGASLAETRTPISLTAKWTSRCAQCNLVSELYPFLKWFSKSPDTALLLTEMLLILGTCLIPGKWA